MVPVVPPTSDQSVISPRKMPLSCSVVMSSMSTLAFTIGPMPTMQTWLSTRFSHWSASSFSSAKTSERPIWTEPSATCERPWPEPPAEMAMETSPLASMKASAAFSTSGWKEVAPEQEMEPASAASAAASPSSVAAVSVVPPQAARPATAAVAPKTPMN